MVLKRIISCLAMVGIAFLVSCYDVQYDNAADEKWYDGLSDAQIVQAMEVKAEVSSVSSVSKSDGTTPATSDQQIVLTWACPHVVDLKCLTWTLSVKTTEIESGSTSGYTTIDLDVNPFERIERDDDVLYTWRGLCNNSQHIVYYKLEMQLTTGEKLDNIVSFIVFPKPMTLKVTSLPSEKLAPAELYGLWNDDCCIFRDIHGTDTSPEYTITDTLMPYSHVNFKIISDFSSMGFGTVLHWSNSSYCRVEKVVTSAGALATIQYNFEDLPLSKIKHEPLGAFDYNDVVFKVDIIKKY